MARGHDDQTHARPPARLTLGEIARAGLPELLLTNRLNPQQKQALKLIAACRTEALGGYVERCETCGYEEARHRSCRSRYCPTCQGRERQRWIEARMERILPTKAFHVVMTLPAELREVARWNPQAVYNLLFEAGSKTLLELSADPKYLGGQLGITAVLHTWSRDLRLHPHLHCVVTGGGLSPDGSRWIGRKGDFLLPIRVVGAKFRGKFLAGLKALAASGQLTLPDALRVAGEWGTLLDRLFKKPWVVYIKRPFDGPRRVFEYLGQYTHRVGLSNRRLLGFDGEWVTLRTRGEKSVRLERSCFLLRFASHVLPKGFTRLRHYGLFAPGNVNTRLARARALLEDAQRSSHAEPATRLETAERPTGAGESPGVGDQTARLCPVCRYGRLTLTLLNTPRMARAAHHPTARSPP